MASASSQSAAFGFSVHTGWAQCVAVRGPLKSPALLYRGRLEIPPGAESVEVFHVAAEMEPARAKRHVENCTKAATERAFGELKSLMSRLASQARIGAAGVVVSKAALPSALDAILRSHLLIHSAEGDFFRRAILQAARDLKLGSVAISTKDLSGAAAAALAVPPQNLPQWLTDYGRTVGRPWGRDEKDAFLAACIAMTPS